LKKDQNIIGLDVMRFIAIFLVLHLHSIYLLPGGMYKYIKYSLFLLQIDGVGIFFVLSGFLIGKILLDMEKTNTLNIRNVGLFLTKRWLRTLPNFYLILGFVILVGGSMPESSIFYFMQNFKTPYFSIFQESWSLSVEEFTYLAFPITFLLFSLITRNSFFAASIFLIVISIVYKFIWLQDLNYTFAERTVLGRFSSIVYGLFFYQIFDHYFQFFKSNRFILFGLGALLIALNGTIFQNSHTWRYDYLSIAYLLTLPFFYFLTLPAGFVSKFFFTGSKISYSLYLINLWPFQYIILPNIRNWFPGLYSNAYPFVADYILYWTLVPLISYFLFYYWEKPWMRLRRFLPA
jgi:peptidoglycan/LPS O-acetylase OafA/YrhL